MSQGTPSEPSWAQLPASFYLILFKRLLKDGDRALVRRCRLVCKAWRTYVDASTSELNLTALPLCELREASRAESIATFFPNSPTPHCDGTGIEDFGMHTISSSLFKSVTTLLNAHARVLPQCNEPPPSLYPSCTFDHKTQSYRTTPSSSKLPTSGTVSQDELEQEQTTVDSTTKSLKSQTGNPHTHTTLQPVNLHSNPSKQKLSVSAPPFIPLDPPSHTLTSREECKPPLPPGDHIPSDNSTLHGTLQTEVAYSPPHLPHVNTSDTQGVAPPLKKDTTLVLGTAEIVDQNDPPRLLASSQQKTKGLQQGKCLKQVSKFQHVCDSACMLNAMVSLQLCVLNNAIAPSWCAGDTPFQGVQSRAHALGWLEKDKVIQVHGSDSRLRSMLLEYDHACRNLPLKGDCGSGLFDESVWIDTLTGMEGQVDHRTMEFDPRTPHVVPFDVDVCLMARLEDAVLLAAASISHQSTISPFFGMPAMSDGHTIACLGLRLDNQLYNRIHDHLTLSPLLTETESTQALSALKQAFLPFYHSQRFAPRNVWLSDCLFAENTALTKAISVGAVAAKAVNAHVTHPSVSYWTCILQQLALRLRGKAGAQNKSHHQWARYVLLCPTKIDEDVDDDHPDVKTVLSAVASLRRVANVSSWPYLPVTREDAAADHASELPAHVIAVADSIMSRARNAAACAAEKLRLLASDATTLEESRKTLVEPPTDLSPGHAHATHTCHDGSPVEAPTDISLGHTHSPHAFNDGSQVEAPTDLSPGHTHSPHACHDGISQAETTASGKPPAGKPPVWAMETSWQLAHLLAGVPIFEILTASGNMSPQVEAALLAARGAGPQSHVQMSSLPGCLYSYPYRHYLTCVRPHIGIIPRASSAKHSAPAIARNLRSSHKRIRQAQTASDNGKSSGGLKVSSVQLQIEPWLLCHWCRLLDMALRSVGRVLKPEERRLVMKYIKRLRSHVAPRRAFQQLLFNSSAVKRLSMSDMVAQHVYHPKGYLYNLALEVARISGPGTMTWTIGQAAGAGVPPCLFPDSQCRYPRDLFMSSGKSSSHDAGLHISPVSETPAYEMLLSLNGGSRTWPAASLSVSLDFRICQPYLNPKLLPFQSYLPSLSDLKNLTFQGFWSLSETARFDVQTLTTLTALTTLDLTISVGYSKLPRVLTYERSAPREQAIHHWAMLQDLTALTCLHRLNVSIPDTSTSGHFWESIGALSTLVGLTLHVPLDSLAEEAWEDDEGSCHFPELIPLTALKELRLILSTDQAFLWHRDTSEPLYLRNLSHLTTLTSLSIDWQTSKPASLLIAGLGVAFRSLPLLKRLDLIGGRLTIGPSVIGALFDDSDSDEDCMPPMLPEVRSLLGMDRGSVAQHPSSLIHLRMDTFELALPKDDQLCRPGLRVSDMLASVARYHHNLEYLHLIPRKPGGGPGCSRRGGYAYWCNSQAWEWPRSLSIRSILPLVSTLQELRLNLPLSARDIASLCPLTRLHTLVLGVRPADIRSRWATLKDQSSVHALYRGLGAQLPPQRCQHHANRSSPPRSYPDLHETPSSPISSDLPILPADLYALWALLDDIVNCFDPSNTPITMYGQPTDSSLPSTDLIEALNLHLSTPLREQEATLRAKLPRGYRWPIPSSCWDLLQVMCALARRHEEFIASCDEDVLPDVLPALRVISKAMATLGAVLEPPIDEVDSFRQLFPRHYPSPALLSRGAGRAGGPSLQKSKGSHVSSVPWLQAVQCAKKEGKLGVVTNGRSLFGMLLNLRPRQRDSGGSGRAQGAGNWDGADNKLKRVFHDAANVFGGSVIVPGSLRTFPGLRVFQLECGIQDLDMAVAVDELFACRQLTTVHLRLWVPVDTPGNLIVAIKHQYPLLREIMENGSKGEGRLEVVKGSDDGPKSAWAPPRTGLHFVSY